MNLQLLHNQVVDLKLKKIDKKLKNKNNTFHLEFTNQYDSKDDTVFNVVFDIKITHPNDFELSCRYVTWFKASNKIDETFKNSSFPKINAPAIAFPFLRSFISFITLNSGYSPILLPSINFVSFNQKNEHISNPQG
jgi:preprotein translocase subunit SecB